MESGQKPTKRKGKFGGATHKRVKVVTYRNGRKQTLWKKIPIFSQPAGSQIRQQQHAQVPDFPHGFNNNPQTDIGLQEPDADLSHDGRTYSSDKSTRTLAWERLLPRLKNAHLSSLAPSTKNCSSCGITENNIILCHDCGPTAYFCYECCLKFHQLACLHVPVVWVGTSFKPVPFKRMLSVPSHDCGRIAPNDVTVIDQYGRQHTVKIGFCGCTSKSVTLATLGLWPSSPTNPKIAIDMRFMELCRCMLLEGTMAVMKFSSTITMYASGLPNDGNKVNLYDALATDSASYHRRFMYDLEHFQGIIPGFPDGTECPICSETADVLPQIVSMDGNFRLVRKKNAGTSDSSPHHKNHFFLEDDKVSTFLKQKNVAHDQICSDFKAGSVISSTLKKKGLDVSGVFGSVCIHDYPRVFTNILDGGEKLGYGVAVINELMEKEGERNLKILYDIACRLRPQLKASNINLARLDLAVSVFHGFAHGLKCRTEYDPKNWPDFRLADGENTERLWSYMGNFAYITREMTPSNRHDLLVDGLLHWGRKAIGSAVRRMDKRLDFCTELEAQVKADLETLKSPLRDQGLEVHDEAIKDWEMKYKARYVASQQKPKAPRWEEGYAILLNKWFSLRWKVIDVPVQPEEIEAKNELRRLEESLQKVEKEQKIVRWALDSTHFKTALKDVSERNISEVLGTLQHEVVERKQLIYEKNKATGQGRAAQLSVQIKKINGNIAKLVPQHNGLPGATPMTVEGAKDPDALQYADLTPADDIPSLTCREIVTKFNTISRIAEEENAIKLEMCALLRWYKDMHILLEESIMQANPPCNQTQEGLIAKLIDEILINERQQEDLAGLVRVRVGEGPDADTNYLTSIFVGARASWNDLAHLEDGKNGEKDQQHNDSDDEMPPGDEN